MLNNWIIFKFQNNNNLPSNNLFFLLSFEIEMLTIPKYLLLKVRS